MPKFVFFIKNIAFGVKFKYNWFGYFGMLCYFNLTLTLTLTLI